MKESKRFEEKKEKEGNPPFANVSAAADNMTKLDENSCHVNNCVCQFHNLGYIIVTAAFTNTPISIVYNNKLDNSSFAYY